MGAATMFPPQRSGFVAWLLDKRGRMSRGCTAARPLNNVAIAPCKFRFEMGFLLRGFQLLTRARGVSPRPFQDIELLEMRIGGSSRTEPNCSYETLFSTGRLKRRPPM